MKIEWMNLDDFNKKALQIFTIFCKELISKNIKKEDEDEPKVEEIKLNKKINYIKSFFEDIKKINTAKDSQLNTIRTQGN